MHIRKSNCGVGEETEGLCGRQQAKWGVKRASRATVESKRSCYYNS